MNDNNIREKLKPLLNEVGMIDDKGQLTGSEELDSLQMIYLVVEIEEMFQIEFPDGVVDDRLFQSMNYLISVIQRLIDESKERENDE